MRVWNPSALTFDGEAVLARMAPRVVIAGEQPLTPEQAGAVTAMYGRFVAMRRPSIVPYAEHNETLPDGTAVRIVSNSGMETLYVTPARVVPNKAIALGGFVLLPQDKDHTSGWNKGAIADSARAYLPAKKDKAELHVKLQAGPVDWRSADGKTILSWDHGGANRYETHLWDDIFGSGGGGSSSAAATGIFYKGTRIETPSAVLAAAIFEGKIVFVAGDSPPVVCWAASPIGTIEAALARGEFTASVSPTWTLEYPSITPAGTYGTDYGRVSAWHFAPDGSKAVCAIVEHTYGIGTWFNRRMRLEVLPQSKLYMNLALDISSDVTATLSKTAYASGEAFSCTVGGVVLDHIGVAAKVNGIATNSDTGDITGSGGALVFHGRRLWGVDFAPDGTELVIEGKRTGSGTLTLNTGTGTAACDFTTQWGIYVNGTELVAASYNMPTIDNASGLPVQTGAGLAKFEYMSLVALDARSLSAVVERLTLTASGTLIVDGAPGLGVRDKVSRTTIAMAITRETTLNGVLEQTITETPQTSLLASVFPRIEMDVSNWTFWLRYGPRIEGYAEGGPDAIVQQYPVNGERCGENYYEWVYRANLWGPDPTFGSGPSDSRMDNNVVRTFPNQVSAALFMLIGTYEADGLPLITYDFVWWPWLGTFLSDGTGSSFHGYLDDRMISIGTKSHIRWPGLAEREKAPLEAVSAQRDSFLWDFEFYLKRAIYFCTNGTRTTGLGFTERAPTYTAHHFRRDAPTAAWTVDDLASIIQAQVVADGNSPDSDSFNLSPVGPL